MRIKKILAAVSAIAMSLTMLSSMAVVEAADPGPTITLSIAESEENPGSDLYDITVNIDVTQCEKGNTVYVGSFALQLGDYIDTSKLLDQELNMETFENEYVNLEGGPAKYASFTPNVLDGVFYYAFADTTGQGQMTPIPMDILTLKNLKLKDGVQTGDIEIGFNEFKIQVGTLLDRTDYTMNVEEINTIMFPGNKEPEPEPEPGLDVEQVGTVFEPTDAEAAVMPNQRAVASIATIEDGQASGSIKWSIDVTGANAGSYDKTFELPTFEAGEVKIGLIVEYDTSEADSVEITGATMVN